MAEFCEPRIAEIAELLLERRRLQYAEALEAVRSELNPGGPGAEAPTRACREEVLERCLAALGRHVAATRSDVGLLWSGFDAAASAQWLHRRLEEHLADASSALVDTLDSGDFGFRLLAAERKRLMNRSASLLQEASAGLRADLDRARRREELAELAAAASDPSALDDRLPLRRRGAFDRDLGELLAAMARSGQPLALVMIDLDHFKSVNDRYGHPVGDEVLVAVAERVVARVGSKGRSYRYGGEEFALLLPTYSAEEAGGLAERLRRDVAGAPVGGRKLEVTASLGVASFPEDAGDPAALLEAADGALYAAKEGGRNRVRHAGRTGGS